MSEEPVILDELRTPLEVVNRINYVLFYIRRGTQVIKQARSEYLEAKTAYLKAFKSSKLELRSDVKSGTVGDREDQAQLANWDLFQKMTIAEAALQHAKEKKQDLEDELSALQTESGLIKKEMELSR